MTTQPTTVPDPAGQAIAPKRAGLLRTVVSRPAPAIALIYLVLLLIAVAVAPLIARYDPGSQDLAHVLAGPSGRHWLGTDQLGRDVASRMLYGGRPAIVDVCTALAVFVVVGVPLGLLAGFLGGRTDRIITRVADLIFAIPGIIVMLMVVAIFPGDDAAAMVTLGLLHTPGLVRIVRGATIACRSELFVKAARLAGLKTTSIMRRHILPSLSGPVIIQVSLFAASTLVVESGLSFLGLMRPDAAGPSWGNLVAQATAVTARDGWLLVPTGGIIALTVVALSVLGDSIRDATVEKSVPTVSLLRRHRPEAATAVAPESTGPDAPLLQVRGLTVALRRAGALRTVVDDLGFSVQAGEAVGLVGESGCGKSTTAKAILGLLPAGGEVTRGSVHFDGIDLARAGERTLSRIRGKRIALVSQDALNSLDPLFTVRSQMREVIRRHSALGRREADSRAAELLRLVRFPDPAAVLDRRPYELSGGMAQRVCIAMAVANEPELLIADEPTSALDVTVQAKVLELLRDLQSQLGMALLVVTHDWGVVADVCDRTMVMYAGQLVESAPASALYHAPRHPYSAALLAADPHKAARGGDLPSVTGAVPEPGAWPMGCHFAARCPKATSECTTATIPILEIGSHRQSRCIHTDELVATE